MHYVKIWFYSKISNFFPPKRSHGMTFILFGKYYHANCSKEWPTSIDTAKICNSESAIVEDPERKIILFVNQFFYLLFIFYCRQFQTEISTDVFFVYFKNKN